MDFELSDILRAEISAHAAPEQPGEACGLRRVGAIARWHVTYTLRQTVALARHISRLSPMEAAAIASKVAI